MLEPWLLQRVYYLWALAVGVGAIIFAAGKLVEKLKLERFVTHDTCATHRGAQAAKFEAYKVAFDARLDSIKEDLGELKSALGIPDRLIHRIKEDLGDVKKVLAEVKPILPKLL